MNNKIISKVNELVKAFQNSLDYQRYQKLKKEIFDNKQAMELIEDIRVCQKKIINNIDDYDYEKRIKDNLNLLKEISPYEEFLELGEKINSLMDVVMDKLNDFFETSVN